MTALDDLNTFKLTNQGGKLLAKQLEAFSLTFSALERILRGYESTQSVRLRTASFTATEEDSVLLVDASAGSITVTLPACEDVININAGTTKVFIIHKVEDSSNTVVIQGSGGATIDGAASLTLTELSGVILLTDGNNWFVSAQTNVEDSIEVPTVVAGAADSVNSTNHGQWRQYSNAGSITLTVNQGAVGKWVSVETTNGGTITFAAGSGVTLEYGASFALTSVEDYVPVFIFWKSPTVAAVYGGLAGA